MNSLVLLTISTLLFKVEAQNTNTRRYYDNAPVADKDKIYYIDNTPNVVRQQNRLKLIDRRDEETSAATNPNDSYLQGFSNGNTNIDSKPGYNNLQQSVTAPSIKLEPPLYGTQDYYGMNINNQQTSNIDESLRLGVEHTSPQLRTGSQLITGSNWNNMSISTTDFGLFLIRNSNQSPYANVVVSPYSISILLALLQQGAKGKTEEQITRVLQIMPEKALNIYKMSIDNIQKRSISRNILKVANNIFVADTFDLNPAFKRTAKQNFGSDITLTRFGNSAVAVQNINRWVAEKTHNKIDKLIMPESVGENTQMVLANAIYFKGLWKTQFKSEATLPLPFHLGNGVTKSVPFMKIRNFYKAGIDSNIRANVVILPFEREQYSLIVILPMESIDLQILLSTLTSTQLLEYQNITPRDIILEIPKFTIKSDTDLGPVLKQMGLTSIFSSQSELSGLGTYRTDSPQVSSAVHTALLSIDEQGGTGAAATAFAAVALSNDDTTIVFKVDKPFLAVLWDNELNIPLFMAKVEDPML